MPWRMVAGDDVAPLETPQLQVLIEGVFERRRFLQLLRDFIVFEDEGGGKPAKKMAGYHQFHAVNVAVEETLRAAAPREQAVAETRGRYEAGRKSGGEPGDRRIGVVWHTQGSGKSLTMVFYAGMVIRLVEHKTRKTLPGWLLEALEQARRSAALARDGRPGALCS